MYLLAGVNDWGGISPVTKDHINPERPWPNILDLRETCADAGFTLRERFGIYPEYLLGRPGYEGFVPDRIRDVMAPMMDSDGLVSKEAEAWSL
jgi:FO synthase